MIIGTAGHIDHGKTTLVRALTGVDTDRLPEERARGISIELGYAYTPLANGDVLGFVDVPGHEKFVHTMLAGASGIDFALLAVAADDGVMPQTREHLDILRLLGVPAGAIAITKIDVVETGRIADVERELRALVAHTVLAGAPIFAVSARTGAGLDALRRLLEARAQAHRRRADDGHFRLAVDRSFALTGIGTVVTGTVHSGEIAVGAHLVIAPGGTQVRVRSIHAQNRASERARAGERCALNLVGIGHQDVGRGDWVVAPPIGLATGRFDARLELLDGETKAFGSAAALHVHVGTARVPGRLVTLEAQVDGTGSGSRPLAQLVLQAPIAAWRGDRFILRDASAMRTIGGGRVLDPFAPARYRRSPQRLTVLRALEADTPASQLTALIGCEPLGVDLRRFASAGNVRDVSAVVPEAGVRRVTGEGVDFAIAEGHWQTLQVRAEEHLATFHQAHRGTSRHVPSGPPRRTRSRQRAAQADGLPPARQRALSRAHRRPARAGTHSSRRSVAASARSRRRAVGGRCGSPRKTAATPARHAVRPALGARSGARLRAAGDTGAQRTHARFETRTDISGRARPVLSSAGDPRACRAGKQPPGD